MVSKKSVLLVVVFALTSLLKRTSSKITCYHCRNTSLTLCGNSTLTCRDPADSCYMLISQDKTRISKSCVWNGHCSPHFLCNGESSCNLHCCYGKDGCNEAIESHWMKDSSTVDWLYIVILYLILPFLITMAKSFFPLVPLPPRQCCSTEEDTDQSRGEK